MDKFFPMTAEEEAAKAQAPFMTVYERFVVGHFLSSFPKQATFEEVLNMLYEQDDAVVVWEPFFTSDTQDVAREMERMLRDLRTNFMPKATIQ
jgi:hypothetical protein